MYYELLYFPKAWSLGSNEDYFSCNEEEAYKTEMNKFTIEFFKNNLEDASKIREVNMNYCLSIDENVDGIELRTIKCYIKIFVKEKLSFSEKRELVRLITKNSQFKWRHILYFTAGD